MIRHIKNGLVFYQFASLLCPERSEGTAQRAEVQHAVFTRLGGQSQGAYCSLNVGGLVGDDATAVQANHELICASLGLQPAAVVTARQVHGAHVAVVHGSDGGAVVPATDALISNEPGVALLLRFADCVPVVLYDPQRPAIGLAHAGWRGLVAGVVPNTIAALQSAFGCRPADLFAGLGPAIGPCCYQVLRPAAAGEVESELVAKAKRVFGKQTDLLSVQPNGAVHFDLPAAVHRQLQQSGVLQIEDSGLCTSCHTDEFFSHRAENGHTGRFAVVVALGSQRREIQ